VLTLLRYALFVQQCPRLTNAIDLGNGLYKILPTPDYDPEDEDWEFVPETIVRGEWVDYQPAGKTVKERILVAREAVQIASS
jgi:hypothetical protein